MSSCGACRPCPSAVPGLPPEQPGCIAPNPLPEPPTRGALQRPDQERADLPQALAQHRFFLRFAVGGLPGERHHPRGTRRSEDHGLRMARVRHGRRRIRYDPGHRSMPFAPSTSATAESSTWSEMAPVLTALTKASMIEVPVCTAAAAEAAP